MNSPQGNLSRGNLSRGNLSKGTPLGIYSLAFILPSKTSPCQTSPWECWIHMSHIESFSHSTALQPSRLHHIRICQNSGLISFFLVQNVIKASSNLYMKHDLLLFTCGFKHIKLAFSKTPCTLHWRQSCWIKTILLSLTWKQNITLGNICHETHGFVPWASKTEGWFEAKTEK